MTDPTKRKVLEFLLSQRIDSLPVNPIEIAERNGWNVMTYDEFAALVGISSKELILFFDSCGFAMWWPDKHRYLIVYNSMWSDPARRWILLHEIAHIYLGHVVARKKGSWVLFDSTSRSYFDGEVNAFVRELIAPTAVLYGCRATEPHEIMELCGTSKRVSTLLSVYIKEYASQKSGALDPVSRKVVEQFDVFIRRYLLMKHKYDHTMEAAQEIAAPIHPSISAAL